MHWWQTGVVYQVYPRSFQDTNGDGVGDLAGITQRLPYLADLGVDAVWLSPVFVSPMVDFGYDIADHTAIDPLFGTLADFDALLERAHALGLKVILDLVPNHTSNRHPWFVESRVSRQSARRDWYIWRNGAPEGGPPNNWLSEFGGSAWQYDPATDQYYYHAFLRAQPDLNWRNPDVRRAMHDIMRFWLDRGVDGFRVDVMWHLAKDEAFRDNPPNPDWCEGQPDYRRLLPVYSTDRPEVHALVREMRAVIDDYPERVLIGEIYLPVEKLVAYYGEALPEGGLSGAHLPFNFSLIEAPWTAEAIAALIARYEAALPPGAWPNWVLGNHDRRRIAARAGRGTSPRRRHAAHDTPGHADPLLRRRARPAAGPDPALTGRGTPGRSTCRGWAAMAAGRRCPGTPRPSRASPRPSPGCRSMPTRRFATSPRRGAIPGRCSPCTAVCWPFAGPSRRSPRGPVGQ